MDLFSDSVNIINIIQSCCCLKICDLPTSKIIFDVTSGNHASEPTIS